jgi:putative inorganic carbon (HCO3(-)) transporter
MRDAIVFAIILGSLPFILKRPMIGVVMFTWISLMSPHRLTYGPAYDFPFAALVAGTTLISVMMSKGPKRLPFMSATIALIVFAIWITITGFFAQEPELVWGEWNTIAKTLLMVFVAMTVLHTEKDIKALAWIVGLSLGYYGLKGGLFTIKSGGTSHVLGPEGSYITDNNTMALALIVVLPILWYLHLHAGNKWLRRGMMFVAIMTAVSIIGSYSRGALLGGATMMFFLWLKAKQKLPLALGVMAVVAFALMFMPAQWFDRMDSIGEYKEDSSAMGRINAWQFALNLSQDHLFGGGFKTFSPRMFYHYAPNPADFHVAHSIYFQVLGDHGYIGLAIFLILLVCAWRTGTRVIKLCKSDPEAKWAVDLATMCQVSLIGYAVGGAFLSLPYYDLYYYIIALLVLTQKWALARKPKEEISATSSPVTDSSRIRGKEVRPQTDRLPN